MNRAKASRILAACVIAGLAWSASTRASEVAVLRGGTRIELKSPLVRQGNTVLLTRADGTLLSLPASELDLAATAAANAAASSPRRSGAARASETAAGAARAVREGPKARVRVTDADVGHPMRGSGSDAADEKKPLTGGSGAGRVEIADYDQQRSEADLLVRGNLHNPGATSATGVRLNVTAVDEKGQTIAAAPALLPNTVLGAGQTSSFSVRLAVGQTPVSILRFAPQWVSAPLAPAGAPAGGAAAPGSPAAEPSAPHPAAQPTAVPYGQGLFYAAPPPSAPSTAPADGKTGYIPGAASPENQPKPPK